MVPCRIAIQQLFVGDPKPRTPRQVIEALRTTFPESGLRAPFVRI